MKTKNYSKIKNQTENLVKKYCKKNYKHDDVFKNHIDAVRNYSLQLANEYHADKEVVEIAALLHDFTHIRDNNHSIHELEGAKFASRYLKGKMAEEKIKLIHDCIKHHRGSKDYKRETIEEQIVACADAMSHFSNVCIFFYLWGASKRGTLEETKDWVKSKLQRSWKKITLKKAREIIKSKYDAALVLLE
jgi:uncharacterized protein